MLVGNTKWLDLSGYDYGSDTIKWKSSNKKIASVDRDGSVKAKKKGKVTITARARNKEYKCKVTVQQPVLSDKKITIEEGSTYTLKVNGTNKKVQWSASGDSTSVKKGTDSLVARFTNTGSNTYDYIHVSAVFYDRNGHCIGYDSHYIDTLKPGDTAIKDFSYPDDEEDNSIKPASYEIYIESADLR